MQNLLASSLLSKNFKIEVHRIIILLVVLYGCETWLLTLRDECRLRVFEKWVLRRIFRLKRDEVTGDWGKNYIMRSLKICTLHPERDQLGDPSLGRQIILKWVFSKWNVGYGLDRAGSGQGQVAGTSECGNEPSGSIKCGEFLD